MTWQISRARSQAYVGVPTWSKTTFSIGLSAVSCRIVFTKFFPYGEYSHAVRKICHEQPDSCTACSPWSFVAPYTPFGCTGQSSRHGRAMSPWKT